VSPYIRELDKRASTTTQASERARLETMAGCYWARVGEFSLAENIRDKVRAEFGNGEYPAVSITLMMLDAMLGFFRDQSKSALNRSRAAFLLASSLRLRREQAFCGAWLAHFEFNHCNWRSTTDALESALAAADESEVTSLARICQVVADAHLHCGDESIARVWQNHAHLLLTGLGDHAAIEALLWNWAALRVHNARLSSLDAPVDESLLAIIGGELASAANYQRIARLSSLEFLLSVGSASHAVMAKDYRLAAEALDSIASSGKVPKESNAHAQVSADLALCRAYLGDLVAAESHMASALDALGCKDLGADDIAIAAGSLEQYFKLVNDDVRSCEMRDLWKRKKLEHELAMTELRSHFAKWSVLPQVRLGPN
jgi:hypothetical protein